jgi:hypothetical protein
VILGGVVEKRGEEETKSMPHAPVILMTVLVFVLKKCPYNASNCALIEVVLVIPEKRRAD